MTEQEAFAIIRNVIKLEGVARQIAVESSKELRRAIKTVRDMVRNLPEGSVERELAYKQLRDFVAATMERSTQTLQVETAGELQAEAPAQADWARRYVNLESPIDNSLTRAALAGVEQATVAGKSLDKIFEGLSRAQMKKIDSVVREGFLTGMNNTQIAKALAGAGKQLQSQHRAIARTAVMSMAQQTHNEIWDANSEVIEGWVWDATMDYRVCPICAPLDGRKAKKRSDLPRNGDTPAHPNCRCMVLPDTGITGDTGDRSMVLLIPKEGTDDYRRYQSLVQKSTEQRVYKTKVKVDGVWRERVALDFAPSGGKPMSMGQMLNRTTHEMQAQVLGSKKKADQFRAGVKAHGADRALLNVTR